jgi:hypothetical protein
MPRKKIDGLGKISTCERARLEALRAVGHEARPGLCARDDLAQRGHHLAAVAHAEREGVRAAQEALELGARGGVEQQALGPALARAEHVAVREAAAGGEPAKA